jgi:SAM-dependent methyltransferase
MQQMNRKNADEASVASFGDEWSRFDQSELAETEAREIFEEYFAVFPWAALPEAASGFDMGCGSGRWARLVAPRVGHLHCIEPSAAIEIARRALQGAGNVSFHSAAVDERPLPPGSQDFGYALGVLHHIPDTAGALKSCVEMLKRGAPFLLYIYYDFDNRSAAFRALWKVSDLLRRGVCRLPPRIKSWVTDAIAFFVYLPLATLARLVEALGLPVAGIPLSYYRKHSLYTMRTDSRDRFGTPLEQRFSRARIEAMMRDAGLGDIRFSERAPFWCAVGSKL